MFFSFGKHEHASSGKNGVNAFDGYVILSVCLIFLFFGFSLFCPLSQNSLVFREGFDFLADYVNPVKHTFAQNVYTGEGATIIEGAALPYLLQEGARLDRLLPPLAYLTFYIPRSMTSMELQSVPMFLVTALWSVVAWSTLLLLACFVLIQGPTWKKLLFCFSVLFSGVMLFSMERGTLVILSSALVIFFIFNYQSQTRWLRELALPALAFAAGLKFSPAILGLLLVMEKRWKDTAKLSVYGVIFIFLPMLFLPGGMNNLQFEFENVAANSSAYLSNGIHVGVGMIGETVGEFWAFCLKTNVPDKIQMNYICYYFCGATAVIGVILAFFERERWRKIFLMILPVLFIPQNSGFYNLLYLLPVVILLCNEQTELTDLKKIVLILLALLFMPLQLCMHQKELFCVICMDLLAVIITVSSLAEHLPKKQPRICHNDSTESVK